MRLAALNMAGHNMMHCCFSPASQISPSSPFLKPSWSLKKQDWPLVVPGSEQNTDQRLIEMIVDYFVV